MTNSRTACEGIHSGVVRRCIRCETLLLMSNPVRPTTHSAPSPARTRAGSIASAARTRPSHSSPREIRAGRVWRRVQEASPMAAMRIAIAVVGLIGIVALVRAGGESSEDLAVLSKQVSALRATLAAQKQARAELDGENWQLRADLARQDRPPAPA